MIRCARPELEKHRIDRQSTFTKVTVYSNACVFMAVRKLCCEQTMYSVSQKIPQRFSDIFPERLGIFSPNFTRLLHVPIYDRLQIFVQLTATLMKLCHIKCDQPVHITCLTLSPLDPSQRRVFRQRPRTTPFAATGYVTPKRTLLYESIIGHTNYSLKSVNILHDINRSCNKN